MLAALLCFASRGATGGATTAPAPSAALRLLTLPDGGRPVVVRATFHLEDLNAIDEEAETFEFSGVLTLVWNDPRQAFDPAELGAGEQIFQGEYQFDEISPAWYPQILLANISGMYETPAVLLRVKPDGTCTLATAVNAVAKSRLNLRRCPLDRQRLEAIFTVFGFDAREVVLDTSPEAGDSRRPDVRVPQWTVERVGVSVRMLEASVERARSEVAALVLSIDVERQPWFLARLVVLPLMMIVMLSWSVFWMDRVSVGDRLGVSFVGVLTAVAYMMVVSDKLPQIAYITLIHGFISLSFLSMASTVVVSLAVGACERNGKSALGHRIDRRCRWSFPAAYVTLISIAVAVPLIFF